MRKRNRMPLVISVLIAGLAATSALYASDDHKAPGSMMERGMMNRDGMMGSMMQMMEQCGQMMQGMMGGPDSRRPNDQWRRAPTKPEEKS